MEIDPEVAALMNDLPASKLPDKLIEAGWGRDSMREAGCFIKPSTTFQPTFEPCVQCGPPFADGPRGPMTHVGETECEGTLMPTGEPEFDFHVSADRFDERLRLKKEREELDAINAARAAELARRRAEARAKLKNIPGACGTAKYGYPCAHQCAHGLDHFGFHECRYCHHLWR